MDSSDPETRSEPGMNSLVGRESLVASIVQTLGDKQHFGVLVVGEPGLGKTALARLLVSDSDGGRDALNVRARPSLKQVPFGALAPFLADVSAAEAGSPVGIYRRLLARLGNQAAGAALPLVVVDDAQDLDDGSSVLLAQLAATRRAKVLVFSRSTPGPPSEFVALWREGLLPRFVLEPLTTSEIHELCLRELGAEVLSSVSAVLARTTAGNPMFLLALLSEGTRDKYLVLRNGVWCLSGELPQINLRLTDLIKGQLRGLTAEEVEVLETVALAEPIALDVLRNCSDEQAVSKLLKDQLIAMPGGLDPRVSLGHPLYGEVIRARVPIGRSRAIRRRVLESSVGHTNSVDGLLRSVSWGLDCGAVLEDDTLLRAAIVANRLFNPEFALRAARVVRSSTLKARALVEIARARMTHGEFAYARELVDEALVACDSLRLAKEATLLSVDLRMRDGSRPADIRSDARRWETLVTSIESARGEEAALSVAVSRLGCRLLHCFALNLEGNYFKAEKDIRAVLSAVNRTEETSLMAHALLGEAQYSTGRPALGTESTATALKIVAEGGHSYLGHREFVLARHGAALTHAGRWGEVRELLQEYSQSANGGLVYFGGVLEFSDGLVALRQGKMRTARKRLILAVEGFRETDIAQLLPLATGLAAYACAMVGDTAGSRRYVTEFQSMSRGGPAQTWLLGEAYSAAGNSLFVGATRSIVELRRIAGEAEAAGMLTLAATALELAVRFGDTGSLARLQDVTAAFDGGEGVVLHAMATAMLARDPQSLETVAESAKTAGYLLIAAECLGQAIDHLTRDGHIQHSRAVQLQLNDLTVGLEGFRSPASTDTDSGTRLTRREQDIVTLASQGYSNREIASQHGVSVRTVEGHLYRIFAKLGISRREDLPEPGAF
ncbi:helix-turn-helix transcriptional regulator [Arthrobacter sp. Sr33]